MQDKNMKSIGYKYATLRRILIIICILVSGVVTKGQSVIFLHHSTGEGVYTEGNVASWISNYNAANNTNYQITERAYPDTPYPWDNFPYDYWNLWIDNQCSNSNINIQCLDNILQNYDVVVFKHCFPGAAIVADDGNPAIGSSAKTLANYKLQYRALRGLMDQYSQKKFIVWTLAPLHRLDTNAENAGRAGEFVNWVKTSWLTEDGKSHPNIYIFNFFGLTAELSATPVNGKVNCLKYNYEISHTDIDSHPNSFANQTVGPVFAQFIVNTIRNQFTTLPDVDEYREKIKVFPIPATNILRMDFSELSEPVVSVTIFNLSGQCIYLRKISGESNIQINTDDFPSGPYIVRIDTFRTADELVFTVLDQ